MQEVIRDYSENAATHRVLVMDDEPDICKLVSEYLSHQNYEVRFCRDVHDFQSLVDSFKPHFIIMDKMIENQDSTSLIENMRKNEITKDIPIVLITGCSDFEEKIRALNMGADEVLFKPFRLEEMGARLTALRRRSALYFVPQENLSYKNFTINARQLEVLSPARKSLGLTETEFKIFHLLVMNKGNLVSREKLVHKALTVRNNNVRTIDVHINSLRSKLGEFGYLIKTMRGRGYMLVA